MRIDVTDNGIQLEEASILDEPSGGLETTAGPLAGLAAFTAVDGVEAADGAGGESADGASAQGVIGVALAPDPLRVGLNRPVGPRATFEFFLKPRRGYYNGEDQEPAMHTALAIPGIGTLILGLPDDRVSALLIWEWNRSALPGANGIQVVIPELPGPEWYHVVLSWDAEQGICSMYVNGTPVRFPDVPENTWEMPDWSEVRFFPRLFEYARVSLADTFTPCEEAMRTVPDALRGRREELFGKRSDPSPLPVERLRGELLYQAALDKPDDIRDWVIDAGRLTFEDGWLNVESEHPDADDVNTGHMTWWCDRIFPDSFIAEWDVRILADHITIVFFAAMGENGEDFFGPGFPERNGEFIYYIKDRITSYHISYQSARARGISNLRKNNRFYLLATGPAGIPREDRNVHHICLVKAANHIQLLVDGNVVIDCVDDKPDRYGPPHGSGRIGFRQMRGGVARYRNLKVWAMREPHAL